MPNGKVLSKALVDMRGDTTGTYQLIMQVFAPAVVTKGKMTEGIMCGSCWSDIVSISDEAFVILVIMNSWNTWVPEDLKIVDHNWPRDAPVWSTAGQGKTACKFGGWKQTGVEKYTGLFKQVRQDRSNSDACQAFDKKMEERVVETLSGKNKKKMNLQNGDKEVSNEPDGSLVLSAVAETITEMW